MAFGLTRALQLVAFPIATYLGQNARFERIKMQIGTVVTPQDKGGTLLIKLSMLTSKVAFCFEFQIRIDKNL